MKKIISVILVLSHFLVGAAAASDRIFVSSSVKDFQLAEEASYLLQCVATNMGKETEFVTNSESKPRIELREVKGKLNLGVFGPQEIWSETVAREEIVAQCPKVEAILSDSRIPAPEPIAESTPSIPALQENLEGPSWWKQNKTLVYIGAGLAVVAGGILYAKSKNQTPGYSSVRPEFP